MQEQFDKVIVDKCNQGVDENSINKDELWDKIAIGSRNRVVEKGNIVRSIYSQLQTTVRAFRIKWTTPKKN